MLTKYQRRIGYTIELTSVDADIITNVYIQQRTIKISYPPFPSVNVSSRVKREKEQWYDLHP